MNFHSHLVIGFRRGQTCGQTAFPSNIQLVQHKNW